MRSIGVGIFVRDIISNTFLIGKRSYQCKRGANCWALPGGMLEENETVVDCVLREVHEETGVLICLFDSVSDYPKIPGLLGVTDHLNSKNDKALGEAHFTFWIETCYVGRYPQVKELTKCQEWRWITLEEVEKLIKENPVRGQHYWAPIEM